MTLKSTQEGQNTTPAQTPADSLPTSSSPLRGVIVIELGGRLGVSACGALLAELGATVIMIEPHSTKLHGRSALKTPFCYGKYSVCCDLSQQVDHTFASEIIDSAGIVLLSSDDTEKIDSEMLQRCMKRPVFCDISATGATGPLARQALSDAMIQALCGIMDTTGLVDGPPVQIGIPVAELSTAIYAATSALAAWRVWRTQGLAQSVDMALYDVAVNSLTTFLPGYFGGGPTSRLGNGHAMGVPWNAYAATDGWVFLCSTSDAHWQKICDIIERPDLKGDTRFAVIKERVVRRTEVDGFVATWVQARTVTDCINKFSDAGLACGEIVQVGDLPNQINLLHRRRIIKTHDPASGRMVTLLGSVLGTRNWSRLVRECIPAPDADREPVRTLVHAATISSMMPAAAGDAHSMRLPLAGIRVIEIGQFTTAPLVGRQLAMLGAEVIKVESPGGETARTWSPHRNGMSLFFMMSNSGKQSLSVDLRSEDGRQFLRDLVAGADVLVENLKPGSLARLGFSPQALARINPSLVYSAICGFGADSAYAGKPAFDTVVQAMSGIVDATRYRGMPLKAGISIADICGGQFGLLAILAAIEQRDTTGTGAFLDISMQDAGAWLTQTTWNGVSKQHPPEGETIRCRDGYVLVDTQRGTAGLDEILREAPGMDRDAVVAAFARRGLACVPVQTVAEVTKHPQTLARELIVYRTDQAGIKWELLGSPLRLSATTPSIGAPITNPGKPDRAELIRNGWLKA